MKKIILIIIGAIILAIAGFVLFKKSNISPQNLKSNKSSNFNLIFKYGVGAKNELNTFNQTYTKDMIMGPPVTVKMVLSKKELNNIYQKMNDLNLFNENRSSEKDMKYGMRSPCSNYYLKIQIDSEQKELFWDDCWGWGNINDKFQQFSNYVIQIIKSKDEYKKLPKPEYEYL